MLSPNIGPFKVNSIVCGDCLNILPQLSDGCIDLVITSPPYNLEIEYDLYDDRKPFEGYLQFSQLYLVECLRVAKADGRLCLNVPLDTDKAGKQSFYAHVVNLAQRVGWKYNTTIIWNKQNLNLTAWGSWLSASAPHVVAPVETIVVLYKNQWKKVTRGESDITKDEFMEYVNGVWNFGSSKHPTHPATFPRELPRRLIKLFSYVGDLVLDPFVGSGTTAAVAKRLGRSYFGCDISEEYVEMANALIKGGKEEVKNLKVDTKQLSLLG